MEPVVQYFLIIAVSAVVMVAAMAHVWTQKDYRIYNFSNVVIAALCSLSRLVILMLLLDFRNRHTFSAAETLVKLPATLANMSITTIVALFLAMAVSNAVLIRHEGMAVKNTVGTMLELMWILATLAVYALVCVMKAHAGSGFGGFLSRWVPYFMYCLIDYGECIMIGIMSMGWVAAHGKSAYDKDFIIIPGCSISKTGGLLPLVRGRVNRAIRYAWDQEIATGRPVRFVPSGGQGSDEIMSEGSAMALYLLSHAAEEDEVFPEKESTNTAENFLFSAKIIREQNPDAKVAFATTNYHVLRCGMLAKRAGLVAEGLGSSTKWYFWPNGFAREIVAIVNMTRTYHIVAVAVLFAASLLITARFG